jgi:hypothetical protein
LLLSVTLMLRCSEGCCSSGLFAGLSSAISAVAVCMDVVVEGVDQVSDVD